MCIAQIDYGITNTIKMSEARNGPLEIFDGVNITGAVTVLQTPNTVAIQWVTEFTHEVDIPTDKGYVPLGFINEFIVSFNPDSNSLMVYKSDSLFIVSLEDLFAYPILDDIIEEAYTRMKFLGYIAN